VRYFINLNQPGGGCLHSIASKTIHRHPFILSHWAVIGALILILVGNGSCPSFPFSHLPLPLHKLPTIFDRLHSQFTTYLKPNFRLPSFPRSIFYNAQLYQN
jgi:hypothetical protein